MKAKFFMLFAIAMFIVGSAAYAFMSGEKAHTAMIYPVVRITMGNSAGSGTIIYSKLDGYDKGKEIYSTYVLTNHHVVESAISIFEEWDSVLEENVKREKRGIIYVEIFQYKNLSIPVGTFKVEAEIIAYNKDEDMALVKLSSEKKVDYVAALYPRNKGNDLHVMDETVAVGCSLAFPPLPTTGIITRKNFQINSLPYHMSSSQIIYGNSGGAMFLDSVGQLIGIPSLVPVVGWGTPITHMGLFIPIDRIYDWLKREHYDFLFDSIKTESGCLETRKREIEEKKKAKK